MTSKVERFTYCWNGPIDTNNINRWRRRYVSSESMRNIFENAAGTDRYALLFHTDEYAFGKLAQDATVQRLLNAHRTLFGLSTKVEGQDILVISTTPNTLPHLRDAARDDVLYVWTEEKTYRIHLGQLYNVCNRLEKFSVQCEHCPNVENGIWRCAVSNMQRWAEKQGYRPFNVCGGRVLGQAPEEFEHELRQIGQIAEFHFVSPKHTQRDPLRIPYHKTFPVRPYNDHYMGQIEKNAEELSARSRRSAETRRRTKICDTECLFADVCDWRHNNWRCRAAACQAGETYDSSVQEKGPFPEDEVRAVYHKWFDQLPDKRSVEDISFIVVNAGAITYARKYEMVLAGMDDNLRLVEFIHVRRGYYARRLFYEFEEALKLLRIPWRTTNDKGVAYYESPPTLRKPVRLLTKDELAIYAEIRQHRSAHVGSAGFGNAFREISHVELRMDGSFGVHIFGGRERRVRGFPGLVEVFFLHHTFKKFKWRGAEGAVHRESR